MDPKKVAHGSSRSANELESFFLRGNNLSSHPGLTSLGLNWPQTVQVEGEKTNGSPQKRSHPKRRGWVTNSETEKSLGL